MITFKQFMTESINDKGIFKAVFVIGIPGAGKSYTVKMMKGPIPAQVVNTDRAGEFLAKKVGKKITGENWPEFRDKTQLMTKTMLSNYIDGMLPLFVDGTSNDASSILQRMGILESLGYDVGVVYVSTSLEKAKARAKEREEEIKREVSPEYIEQVNKLNRDNVSFLKSKVSFFIEFKNESDTLDNEAVTEAFRAVQSFFNSPIKNPVGKRTIEEVLEKKQKYLVPAVISKALLDQKIQAWYDAV